MSLHHVLNIASSGMSAQSQRLNVVASNLANAESVSSSYGETYRARQVIFQAVPASPDGPEGLAGVQVAAVVEDQRPLKMVYDPNHPLADGDGYVAMPNVNPVEEMVNMISSSNSYQANVEAMNVAKQMLLRTLSIGQS